MVIRLPAFVSSVALICATLVVSNDAAAAVPDRMTVETKARYTVGASEADALDRWLARTPEAEPRSLDWGTVTISSFKRVDPLAIRTANAPPVPLPTRGTPGEQLTIINELPGGFRERWTFEWVAPRGGGGGGEWKQTHYESLAPVSGLYRPDEL